MLHAIGGRSLVHHAMSAARGTQPDHLVVVVRHGRDLVAAHVAELDPDVLVADQDEVPAPAAPWSARSTACRPSSTARSW